MTDTCKHCWYWKPNIYTRAEGMPAEARGGVCHAPFRGEQYAMTLPQQGCSWWENNRVSPLCPLCKEDLAPLDIVGINFRGKHLHVCKECCKTMLDSDFEIQT